jgi:hypothetical protein
VGDILGPLVGSKEGFNVGVFDGSSECIKLGFDVGSPVGVGVGAPDGIKDGLELGDADGLLVGFALIEGLSEGAIQGIRIAS